jgi:hypothetical protein
METRKTKKLVVALAMFGAIIAPGSAVFGANATASANDEMTSDAIVGGVEERSAVDGGTAVLAFGLLCAAAAFAGGRRVWSDDEQDFDAELQG